MNWVYTIKNNSFTLLMFCLLYCGYGIGIAHSEPSIKNPDFKVRAFHFVINGMSVEELRLLIDKAGNKHFNTLIIGLYNGVNFQSLTLPLSEKKILSVQELQDVVSYARAKGLLVIPEVKLLTQQQFLMVKYHRENGNLIVLEPKNLKPEQFMMQNMHPEFLYNSATYNPNSSNLYSDAVFPLLKEIIELIKPQAIHIGHDEAAGINKHSREKWLPREKWLQGYQKMLPAKLFVKDVRIIHDYLAGHGVETWMWGDMLLGSREFPSMYQRGGGLNGGSVGYGLKLLSELPKDIVICDWHYSDPQKDFPTLTAFREAGFRVLGATWKNTETIKNFSSYAAKHRARGMIATTWIHTQRRDWDIVDKIIEVSGDSFNKDFPDQK